MKLTRCLKSLTLLLFGILLSSSPVKAQSSLKTLPRSTSSTNTTTATQTSQSGLTVSTSTVTSQKTAVAKAQTIAPKVQVLSNSKATLTFNFAIPSIVQKQLNGQTVSFVSTQTIDNQVQGTAYPVPSFSYVVQGRIQLARITQQSGEGVLENVILKSQPESFTDQPIGVTSLAGSTSTTTQVPSTYPTSMIAWHYAGTMRGTEVSNLKISPYTYNAETKTVRYVQQVTVEVTLNTTKTNAQSLTLGLNQASILKQVPSNRSTFSKSTTAISQSTSTKTSLLSKNQIKTTSNGVYGGLPVKPKYRFIINADGAYQIGYFEFQDAKFPQDFYNADPRTFRVFNKGIEIPIIVKGETDGKFNRDDYIEFLAKANRVELSDASRPDMYNDPYTDENVYYFYWESAATDANRGLRMVDVPGQIRRTIPAKSSFNLSGKSFRSTLHFEKDNIKDERLSGFYSPFNQEEYTKTRNESDHRDTKFWEEIAFGRSSTHNITIPNPDLNVSSDPESLRVVAAFHGLSMVALGGLPQNTARIAVGNPSSPIIAAESSWGTNINASNPFASHQDIHIVDVRLPITEQRTFASSGNGVIQISNRDNISIGTTSRVFLFNWLRLTYRRLYRANNNELTFTAPPSSRPGLYQFEITGFTTPEIEIYKPGIGKLTNFIIEQYSETDYSGKVLPETFYRATF
ncbi:MAG: hypothetical protein HGB11_05960, partial [Chlorobiales bacterium]|nr:hypothetical protein [Chlorobiales bacterium]